MTPHAKPNPSGPSLTPVHLKWDTAFFPENPASYVLARNGLFLARNHPFFQSAVPVPLSKWPRELAEQTAFMRSNYPKIPQRMVELVVGFFDHVWQQHTSEAMVLLGYDLERKQPTIIIPEQIGIVTVNSKGRCMPVGLDYVMPTLTGESTLIFGSIHSHGDGLAFSSDLDKADERSGLHIVVGRLDQEPPSICCQACVDGHRFYVPHLDVLQGYQQRALDVPEEWLSKIVIERAPPMEEPSHGAPYHNGCHPC
jgi:hypothetical protein